MDQNPQSADYNTLIRKIQRKRNWIVALSMIAILGAMFVALSIVVAGLCILLVLLIESACLIVSRSKSLSVFSIKRAANFS